MGLEQYRVKAEKEKYNEIVFADILNDIDDSWSVVEKAKYIHDCICKVSTYDERFIFSSNPELLNAIYNKKVNVDIPITPIFICKALNEIYSELLNRVGIKNIIISKPSTLNPNFHSKDIALLFYDETGNAYYTNIAADLQRSKYGMRTRFFGENDNDNQYGVCDKITILTQDELRKVDIRTRYLKRGGIYSDNVFELIADEIKQTSHMRTMLISIPDIVKDYLVTLGINDAKSFSEDELKEYVNIFTIDDIMRIKIMVLKYFKLQDSTSGVIENKKHYKDLFRSVFTRMEKKRCSCFDMIKEQGDTFEVLSVIKINLRDEGTVYYIYSEKTHQYEPLSIEDVLLIARDYKPYQKLDLLDEHIQK